MKFCPECASPLQPGGVDDIERLVCGSDCGFVHWDNPIPVVAALVRLGDRFVLARNKAWPPGFFSVISGFLEKGETPHQCAARETQEELGLTCSNVQFIGHYPFAQKNQIIMAFMVQASGAITMNAELAELRVLSLEELKSYDFGPLKLGTLMVRDWLRGFQP